MIIQNCLIKSEIIEVPRVAYFAQNGYRKSSLAFQQDFCYLDAVFLLEGEARCMIQKLGVSVSVEDYVEIEDHNQIHEE